MAKKTGVQREADRIAQVEEQIDRLRFPPGGPLDRTLKVILYSGVAIEGQVTGGAIQRHLQELDEEAAAIGSDMLSGEVELTDAEGKAHLIDLLDIESMGLAHDLLN